MEQELSGATPVPSVHQVAPLASVVSKVRLDALSLIDCPLHASKQAVYKELVTIEKITTSNDIFT